jgi:RNA polymerase sigma factor (sigma-70 family)
MEEEREAKSGFRPGFQQHIEPLMLLWISAKMAQAVGTILSRMRTRLRSATELRKDARCLQRIIRSEREPARRILELYFIERCPVDDIAIRLGLSAVTVRRHLLRAIHRFEEERGP